MSSKKNEDSYDKSLIDILENSSYKPSKPKAKSPSVVVSDKKSSLRNRQSSLKRQSKSLEIKYESSDEEGDPYEKQEEETSDEEENTVKKEVKEEYSEKKENATPNEDPELSSSSKKKFPNREIYEEILEKVRKMREKMDAPVDLVGSHLNFSEGADDATRNFQWLTSIVLSVQTKDEKTHQVMKKLLSKGLSLDFVYEIPEKELYNLIFEINFNKKKATFLKQIAKKIKEEYDGIIPDTVEELIKFPGIGKKIAILYVQFVKGTDVGIAVDTHVHRISNRLAWVKTSEPDKTREGLESFIEKKYWTEVNQLLVGFGQQICKPINPKCQDCLLNDICPEGKKNTRYLKIQFKKKKTK